MNGALGLVEMLDRPHRVDGIEAGIQERQLADVAEGGFERMVRRALVALEGAMRLSDDRRGDVDPVGVRALPAGPRQNARVLRFVPEIRFQDLQAGEGREMLGEQPPLVVRVVARRDRPAQVRKPLADACPEIAVGGPRSHRGEPATVQFHVPSATDNAR
jgi:hypothetical protein